MKNIYYALTLLVFLASCTVYRKPYEFKAGMTDYNKFPNFFFTESNSVTFEYTPIGSIFVQEQSGYEVISKDETSTKYRDDVIGSESTIDRIDIKTSNKFIAANLSKGLEEIYNLALKKGANGIINLKLSGSTSGYYITGMAIKR